MMLSEIPSPHKERDTQMLSSVHSEPGNKPESIVIPTPKDRLIGAIVSLVMLHIPCRHDIRRYQCSSHGIPLGGLRYSR